MTSPVPLPLCPGARPHCPPRVPQQTQRQQCRVSKIIAHMMAQTIGQPGIEKPVATEEHIGIDDQRLKRGEEWSVVVRMQTVDQGKETHNQPEPDKTPGCRLPGAGTWPLELAQGFFLFEQAQHESRISPNFYLVWFNSHSSSGIPSTA